MENVVVVRDGDEELSLFLEMRRREKIQFYWSLILTGVNSVDKTSTKSLELLKRSCVKLPMSAVEKFLDSENDKSDYEWLLAAPETLGGKQNSMVNVKEPKARSIALKPRVENIPQEPVTRSVKASKPTPRTASSKQANTAAEVLPSSKPSRQATPTSRATLSSTRLTNSARNSNQNSRTTSNKSNPRASALTRSSSVGKSVSSAKSTTPTIPETRARPVSASRSRVHSSSDRSTGRSKISNDVNPVLMGTQMVERVVNMRKLPPPKFDDNTCSGFGRTLSRSSLDMALRHMNIRHSVSKNLRVTINAPTNSMNKNESS
ncbi:uncharacterized protein LOC110228912 [Arabidopsis lyrata subsp. lyrata]|uniref:uncharacterized protein LOC110228912 n=1 Tax=Arabidopsis lyrata subsp. lyrata TaxID=81972 RepID=UPI000A29D68F|nr:uncharacterized protein LOC110228912 [Arabidopsis lyrata subsp. lyrata]|eukprot:XP_020882883.1 uncharacterized protein LOC110228912 [Arabidopsis lyrata subsp. lyrata]